MRVSNEGSHGRLWTWLMTAIVIYPTPVVDSVAADITVTALAV